MNYKIADVKINWEIVAKFVDKYMHFADFDENDKTQGTACKGVDGYYEKAREAYEAAAFESYRAELCTLDYVVARLQAWAEANGKTFTVTAGVGAFSASQTPFGIATSNSNNGLATVAIIAGAFLLVAVGGFFLLKRKER